MRKVSISMAVVLVIGLFAACSQDEEDDDKDQEQQVLSVETADITNGDLMVDQSLYGRTKPAKTTPVTVQSPSEITELNVAAGDKVEEDDQLATVKSEAGTQKVKAQADGEITNLNVQEDDVATQEDPLMVIADFDSMTLSFTVTADEQRDLGTDDTYTTVIDGTEYDAAITYVGSMPDDTGLYPVEASVDNADRAILSGLTAKLIVPEKKVSDSLILPTEAVVTESGETFVFVVEDDKAVKKGVTVKESQSRQSAVKGDVKKGDQVVVNGLLTLSDGANVDVVQEGDHS